MAQQASSRWLRFVLSAVFFLACAFQANASVAQALTAQITDPSPGASNVDMSRPIQWTAVDNAQAYYLYVGTSIGAQDLFGSGETRTTASVVGGLPSGQTVFARLWTKAADTWRFVDTSFTVGLSGPVAAVLTAPLNGARNVDTTLTLQWVPVRAAQAYYVYIGSTAGANDMVNSGEIQQTSYLATGLPPGQTIFVRLWTKNATGLWRFVDTSFASLAVASKAVLTSPADAAIDVDQFQQFTWTTVAGAEAYYLYVGSSPGATDLLNTGETLSHSFPMLRMPAGVPIYARLWTYAAGSWAYGDTTFTASASNPVFVFPLDGGIGVDPSTAFRWKAPAHADRQRLRVGTSPGAGDLFDSGEISATSLVVNGLPATGTVYARAQSRINGSWLFHEDIAFTLEAASPVSSIAFPADGQAAVDTGKPFEWSAAPLARGYRLLIGTTPGASDLHDSGEIHVTRRFVPNLPLGPLFGRLQTRINQDWFTQDFTFTVGANQFLASEQISSATWATDVTRRMALADNLYFSWTLLARETVHQAANCADYTQALLAVLGEMNLQLRARRLDVSLNPNYYDSHTLVEMLDSTSGRWLLLDATFDLTVTRTADGSWASADDVSTATRAGRWNDVSYVFLGDRGDYYARRYYLDFPLLFVNVYHLGQSPTAGQGAPVAPYMLSVPMPVASAPDMYAVGCVGDRATELLIDGAVQSVDCNGVDGLSHVFISGSVSPTANTVASAMLYRPKRHVF